MSRELECQLLEQARAGSFDAFGELQAALEPPIRRFIRRLIGYHEAEDDIVQTVFIALYRNMHRIDPVAHLRSYIYKMVRNRCYDELRSQGRFQKLSLDDESVELWVSFTATHDHVPESEEVAHWVLLNFEVREAMDRLPELQRQTLILYSEEEMSYAEIAEAMNSSIGTVKSRLFYAKKTLRHLLRPETVAALDAEFQHDVPSVRTQNREDGASAEGEETWTKIQSKA